MYSFRVIYLNYTININYPSHFKEQKFNALNQLLESSAYKIYLELVNQEELTFIKMLRTHCPELKLKFY